MKEIKHVPSPLPALLAQEGPHVPRGPSVGLGRTVLPMPVPVMPPSQHLHPSTSVPALPSQATWRKGARNTILALPRQQGAQSLGTV